MNVSAPGAPPAGKQCRVRPCCSSSTSKQGPGVAPHFSRNLRRYVAILGPACMLLPPVRLLVHDRVHDGAISLCTVHGTCACAVHALHSPIYKPHSGCTNMCANNRKACHVSIDMAKLVRGGQATRASFRSAGNPGDLSPLTSACCDRQLSFATDGAARFGGG